MIIPARPPMCLRCKVVGHVRKNCNTPYCRYHKQYGHATEGCSAEKAAKSKTSYASVTKGSYIAMEGLGETEDMDETDETDDIDGTAGTVATGLRNDCVHQTASGESGPPLPQHAAGPLERGEPPERDGHARTLAGGPAVGGTAGDGKQRTTMAPTTSTTLNIDDNVTTDGPPATSVTR